MPDRSPARVGIAALFSLTFATAALAGPPTTTTTATPTTTTTSTTTTTLSCDVANPVTIIVTIGKGQSPSNNPKLTTTVTGNIIDPSSLGNKVHRIPVCAGTDVSTVTVDTTGTPTVTKSSAGVSCDASGNCSISSIGATEKFTVRSTDGKDTDTLTFLPR